MPCTKMTSGTDVGYICAGWFKQKGDVSHTSSGYRIARIWMENALAAAAHDTCCGDNSSPGLSFLISPYKHLFYFFAFLFPFSFFFFLYSEHIYMNRPLHNTEQRANKAPNYAQAAAKSQQPAQQQQPTRGHQPQQSAQHEVEQPSFVKNGGSTYNKSTGGRSQQSSYHGHKSS